MKIDDGSVAIVDGEIDDGPVAIVDPQISDGPVGTMGHPWTHQ